MVEPAKVEIELAEGEQVVKVGDVEWYVKASLTPPVLLSERDFSLAIEKIRQLMLKEYKKVPSENLIQAIYGLEASNSHVRAWQRANA